MNRTTFLISLTAMTFGIATLTQAGSLILTIDTQGAIGTLRAAMFDSQASFEDQMRLDGVTTPANGNTSTIIFDNLEPGSYGVAVFLDMNGNEELDRNLFGAPTEPYGFSMNPKIGMFAPKFEAFRFDHDGDDQQFAVQLNGL